MEIVILLAGFAATVLAVMGLCRRFTLSAPLVLMVVGVIGSFLPFVHEPELSPELVLVGLLPPLLYAAAVNSSLIDFRKNITSIGWLSVGLVLFTTFGVGAIVHALMPIGWPGALAIGAIVAPPDAVAATAIGKAIGLPRQVVTVLEGESLVNDATALVSLRTAVAAMGAAVTVLSTGFDFLRAVVVAVVVGMVVAKVMTLVFRRVTDMLTGTALTFLVPYFAYVPAEELKGSGVLAVVVAGLAIGNAAPRIVNNGFTRMSTRINWMMIQFLLENSVFLLLGLQMRRILTDARHSDMGISRILLVCGATLAGVIALRIIWVLGTRLLIKAGRRDSSTPVRESVVIAWAGMRGVVTLAAAFTLPASTPHRPVLILIAMTVTVGTLLVQGTTLPAVARALRIAGPDPREDALQEAIVYQRAGRAGLTRAREAARPGDDETLRRIEYSINLRGNQAWERLGRTDGDAETPSDAYRRLRLVALQGERDKTLKMRDSGEIDQEVVAHVLGTLDAEEAGLMRVTERSELVRSAPLSPHIPTAPCVHLEEAPCMVPPDNVDTCHECEIEGLEPVHLRMCLTCGHVACCDSSQGLHATKHYKATGHPVMRSVEPGESWRWCYVDELTGAGAE